MGKMGGNIARQLIRHGWHVVGFDKDKDHLKELEHDGVEVASSIKDFVERLPRTKIVWLMLPAGKIIDKVIEDLSPLLKKGDTIMVKEKSQKLKLFEDFEQTTKGQTLPPWIKIDKDIFKREYIEKPEIDTGNLPFDIDLVGEFYAR